MEMKTTGLAFACLACISVGIAAASVDTCLDSTTPLSACVTVAPEADVVLSVMIDDEIDSGLGASAAGFAVSVDGRNVQELLVFPGTGRRAYDAIVGPLAVGSHTVSLQPSTLWPESKLRAHHFSVRVVHETDADFLLVRHAPAGDRRVVPNSPAPGVHPRP